MHATASKARVTPPAAPAPSCCRHCPRCRRRRRCRRHDPPVAQALGVRSGRWMPQVRSRRIAVQMGWALAACPGNKMGGGARRMSQMRGRQAVASGVRLLRRRAHGVPHRLGLNEGDGRWVDPMQGWSEVRGEPTRVGRRMLTNGVHSPPGAARPARRCPPRPAPPALPCLLRARAPPRLRRHAFPRGKAD